MSVSICVDNLAKRYQLGSAHRSLREAVGSLLARLAHSVNGRAHRETEFWALRDVSFEVKSGEALGVIGPNGAGKTTLLKLLSKVTYPTLGSVEMHGRVSSLIELGAGFHPDLTGRENIYLNGVILGLKRREIDTLFDSIVEFAGLERFIDTPVKRYSSGMYVRLGFSVAAHVEPEILLIDEVLAVGDISFRAKCAERMKHLRASGTTILFVSHNMHAVAGLCDKALLLDQGKVGAYGSTNDVIQAYQRLLQKVDVRVGSQQNAPLSEDRWVDIVEAELCDAHGGPRQVYELGEALVAKIRYHAHRRIEGSLFSAGIVRADGLNVCSETSIDQVEPQFLKGPGVVELTIPELRMIPGVYSLVILVVDRNSLQPYVMERVATFQVVTNRRYIDGEYGVFLPDFRWRLLSPPPV